MALRHAPTNETNILNSTPQYAVNWSLEGTNSSNHLWIPDISTLMHFSLSPPPSLTQRTSSALLFLSSCSYSA